MPPDDLTLVRRARGGDRDAFASLARRHSPCCAPPAARRPAATPSSPPTPPRRPCSPRCSRSTGSATTPSSARGSPGSGSTRPGTCCATAGRPPPTPADAGDPTAATDLDADLDDERAATRIRRAIATLPPGQRDAVALFYLAGLTHAEAAEHLGVPAGAVKARLHKARATLRRRLDPLWKEQFAMPDTLVPMHVADVRRAGGGARHVLLLETEDDDRTLPIWVGPPEASAIAGLLEGVELTRPGPYDFAAVVRRVSRS